MTENSSGSTWHTIGPEDAIDISERITRPDHPIILAHSERIATSIHNGSLDDDRDPAKILENVRIGLALERTFASYRARTKNDERLLDGWDSGLRDVRRIWDGGVDVDGYDVKSHVMRPGFELPYYYGRGRGNCFRMSPKLRRHESSFPAERFVQLTASHDWCRVFLVGWLNAVEVAARSSAGAGVDNKRTHDVYNVFWYDLRPARTML